MNEQSVALSRQSVERLADCAGGASSEKYAGLRESLLADLARAEQPAPAEPAAVPEGECPPDACETCQWESKRPLIAPPCDQCRPVFGGLGRRTEWRAKETVLNDPLVAYMKDGDRWSALIGADLQEGDAGFGDGKFEALEALAQDLRKQRNALAAERAKLEQECAERGADRLGLVKEIERLRKDCAEYAYNLQQFRATSDSLAADNTALRKRAKYEGSMLEGEELT